MNKPVTSKEVRTSNWSTVLGRTLDKEVYSTIYAIYYYLYSY